MTSADNINEQLSELKSRLYEAKNHEERERKFAQEANVRFEDNLTVFKKYYPDIYSVISNIKLRQDFCIHVTTSGHANIYPNGKDIPLYGDNPLQQAIDQVNHYTENANFSRTNYFENNGWESSDSRLHVQYMLKLAKKLGTLKSSNNKRLDQLPDNFPSCLIFGVGLGYHIPELLTKHSFDYLFICEPDLELFYASLFCIDWKKIVEDIDKRGGCLFLHIGVSYEDFFNEIFKIAEDIGAFSIINSFCYQHYPSDDITQLIKTFFDNYYQLHQGFGFYNDAITGLAHTFRNVENKAALMFASKYAADLLKDIPVFVVGNGPSLDDSIEIIRAYQDQAIIIAGGTAFQSLQKANIQSDFHVLVERPKITYDIQKKIAPKSGYHNVNLLTVDVMYPDVLGLYKWSGVALKGPEAGSTFLSMYTQRMFGRSVNALPGGGPLVSNTALAYAVTMGFKDIYLFGVDNGYPLSGETHSKLSIYNDTELKKSFKPLQGANIRLEGNFGKDVMAAPLLAVSKTTFERLLSTAPQCNVYNVGNGAKIRGTVPLHEEDIFLNNQPIDKQSTIELIKSQHFKNIEFDNAEELIGFEEFQELCDYLIDIGKRKFFSREEAHDILKAQQRLVYAYRKSAHPHFFHLIKGTLLYFHCPLITQLYYFEDTKNTLDKFKELLEIWLEFLGAIKADFPVNWKNKCTWSKSTYEN